MHAAFKAAGFQLLPVGGCVRDFLLGLEPDDIDLATDAMPEQIIELLSDYKFTSENLQGKAFGVLRVQTKYFPDGIEIATFRIDQKRKCDFQSFIRYIQEKKPVDYEKKLHLFTNLSNE